MHNNYFFLKQLARALHTRLAGYTVGEIFSQSKDELIMAFYQGDNELYLKAHLSPLFSCLSFPERYARARRNSVDLFPELIGKTVVAVEVFDNDRSFRIRCGALSLVFKLYGNKTNILLFENEACVKLYKQKFAQDAAAKIGDFHKKLDLSLARFMEVGESVSRFIPTLGKELADTLERQLGTFTEAGARWQAVLQFIDSLDSPQFYIIHSERLPRLSLLCEGENCQMFTDPVTAINTFFNEYTQAFYLGREKEKITGQLRQKIRKAQSYLDAGTEKLNELENFQSYGQIADIIMANLHLVPPHATEVELFDFYHNNTVKIKLKKDLSPQKNAENYYRKAKNQKIEIAKLKENLRAKEKEIQAYEEEMAQLEKADSLKQLRKTAPEKPKPQDAKELGYHRLSHQGFEILVGKNARRNDELTFKIAHKNDLWFHAKDVAGSHVIIRQVPGKKPGEAVIERAASLAAYFSKRKGEALVPVSYTERKYVRKTKDLAPGQVIVEKETVVLVAPQGLD